MLVARSQKVVPRKMIRFKTVPVRKSKKVAAIKAKNKIRVLESERTALCNQNSHFAIALNNCKGENAELFSQMNDLKGEILRLQTELAVYRTKHEYVGGKTPKSPSEFDAKLESCLEGPRSILVQAMDQAEELRLSLNAALKSISNSGSVKVLLGHSRRKDSSPTDTSKRPITLENNRRNGKGSIAHIAPRVGGVEIRKPMVCLPKMSMADLSNMAIALRDPDIVNPMVDQPEAENGEDVPFIDEDGDLNDPEQSGIGQERYGRRRRVREYPSPTIEPLIEMDEDEVSDEELPVLRLLRSRVSVDFSSSVQEAQNQPRRDRRSSILGGEIPQPSTSSGPSSLDVSAPESRPSRNSGTSRKPSIDFAVPRVEISSSLNDAQRPSTSRGKSRSSFHRPDLRRRSTVSNGFPRYQAPLESSSSDDDSELPSGSASADVPERSHTVNGTMPSPAPNNSSVNVSENRSIAQSMSNNEDGSFADPWYAIDPLEGPSWLFEDTGRAETMPIRTGNFKSPNTASSAASTSRTPSRLNMVREASSESSATLTQPISTPPRSTGPPQLRRVAKRSNGTETHGASLQEDPDEQINETEGRSRRRAASAAISSLKEPSMNKKLRQGDPISNSIYKDFVPNGKGKEKRKASGRKQSK